MPVNRKTADTADQIYRELIHKLPEDIRRYIELKDQIHKSEIRMLKRHIRRLEREIKVLNQWLEVYMPGSREPENL